MFLGEQLASKPSAWGSNPHPGANGERGRWQASTLLTCQAFRARLGSIPRLSANLVSKKLNQHLSIGNETAFYIFRKRGHDHGQQDIVRKPSGRIDPANRHHELRERSSIRT